MSELSKLSFGEFGIFVEEFREKQDEEFREKLLIFWKSVYWNRSKDFPTYKEVLSEFEGDAPKPEQQSVDDMARTLKSFAKRNKKGGASNGKKRSQCNRTTGS